MKQKTTLSVFALAIVAILGIGMVSAFGFGHGFMNNLGEKDRIAVQEERESMRTAIENQDFESWKSLMKAQIVRMQEQITEENFNQITEMHKERIASGEYNGEGKGMHNGFGKEMSKGYIKDTCPFAETSE